MSALDPRFVTTLTEGTPLACDAFPTVALDGNEEPLRAETDLGSLIGRRIGRYLVLEPIGAGGMGVVLRAHDPELDRQVALKVLTTRTDQGATHDERLYREAQALARLTHENVVAVHDVGMHEGAVFMAMELIDGLTLTGWLRAEKRSRREILRVFRAAGRGLSAAHAAGLVHRDFKPSNVMVGRDGRVRVLDFGVARASEELPAEAHADTEVAIPLTGARRLSTPLTQQGALLGTPLYMSPEQLRKGLATTRSDQFCFCVSLWEALCGARPFAAGSVEELLSHIAAGRFEPHHERLPAWLRRLLVRGLSHDPDARFASMEELLGELERRPALRMRRMLTVAAIAACMALAVLGVLYVERQSEAAQARCESAASAMQRVWNPAQERNLTHAFSKRAGAYGSDTAARVARLFDGYADGWGDMSREACLATYGGMQTENLLDRRSACLERRRLGLAALLERFVAAPDIDTISGAVPAVFALPKLADCADVEALTASRGMPKAPATRREIARIRAVLARATAHELAGQWREGLALVEPLEGPARSLGWEPLELELAQLRARLQTQVAERMTDAQTTYDEALHLAAVSGDDHAVAGLWVELIGSLGGNLGKPLDALSQARAAELALSRIHAGPNDLRRADLAHNVAFAAWRAGRFEEARTRASAALEVRERVLGKDHYDVAGALAVLSLALQGSGDLEGAVAARERALLVRRRALGNDHPKVGVSLDQLAVVRVLQGRIPEAIALHREALAMQERVLGPDHADLGMSLNNLGSLHLDMGQYDEAEPLLARALAVWQRSLDPSDPDLAIVHLNLGLLALGRGDAARAREACQRALALDESALGPDTPVLGWEYTCLGDAAVLAGTARAALPLLERALELRVDAVPLERADTQLALARALSQLGEARARALDLARAARATYAQAGPVGALRLSRTEHVLAQLAR